MWYVYLLQCADATYYCGITTDPQRRLEQHNGLRAGGARYTRSRRPVQLLIAVPVANRSEAGKLERSIQSLPRTRKRASLEDFLSESPSVPKKDPPVDLY